MGIIGNLNVAAFKVLENLKLATWKAAAKNSKPKTIDNLGLRSWLYYGGLPSWEASLTKVQTKGIPHRRLILRVILAMVTTLLKYFDDSNCPIKVCRSFTAFVAICCIPDVTIQASYCLAAWCSGWISIKMRGVWFNSSTICLAEAVAPPFSAVPVTANVKLAMY